VEAAAAAAEAATAAATAAAVREAPNGTSTGDVVRPKKVYTICQ